MFRITEHCRERMGERGIEEDHVLAAANDIEFRHRWWWHNGRGVGYSDGLKLVRAENLDIVTVMRKENRFAL